MKRQRPVVSLDRRQFLVGATGFTLALPVLSSLLVQKAHGADPVFVRRPRLYWITTDHGGALERDFFPTRSPATATFQLFDDHRVTAGPLRTYVPEGRADHLALSPILQARAAALGERRLAQLNVLRGIDCPFNIGHHTGGHLGNYARNDGLAGLARQAQGEPRPTIDQLLAWSPAFYQDLGPVRERALVMGSREISFGYSHPSAAAGSIQNVRATTSSLELFHRIFAPGDTSADRRVPVVDRVLESYRRLRNGNRRLSSADRQRLDDHMDRVSELQRKLNAAVPSCEGANLSGDDSARHTRLEAAAGVQYAQLHNEVAAAAFICGATRIAVIGLGDGQRFADYAGDWHADVAHYWHDPEKQALLAAAYQRIFEDVFLDMVERLHLEEADGTTFLDNALVVWTQESGMTTHVPLSMPILTAGSAAGFFRTGQSLDYRRVGHPDSRRTPTKHSPA